MTDIRCGDCLSVMPTLPENSIDTIITDPPYGLDFMGKEWDHGVPGVEFWQAALRVAKPGAILMAFGGTRTFHRLACAIEDAGWEIRDTICYLYGSGFPKSLDISKAIEATEKYGKSGTRTLRQIEQDGDGEPYKLTGKNNGIMGETRVYQRKEYSPSGEAVEWSGYGTALKPAWEPIIVAMKPLEGTYAENAQKWGVAGLWIEGGRIGTEAVPINRLEKWSGFGQEKRPDYTQEINNKGRWPANLLLDEESARLLDEQSGECGNGWKKNYGEDDYKGRQYKGGTFGGGGYKGDSTYVDHGGASRFFYTAKASPSERNAGLEDCEGQKVNDGRNTPIDNPFQRGETIRRNTHPTVKPVDLMRYLCKLTKTPTGGVVLDPFMGSGTTGVACVLEHRDFIGIELQAEYAEIARKRIADMSGPLFAEAA